MFDVWFDGGSVAPVVMQQLETKLQDAGVGGSSPPVATNSISAQSAENVSLKAAQSDSEFATQNRDSVPLECCAQTVPNLRPKVTLS